MQHKYAKTEWKADTEGSIEGYGSVFGVLDAGGDVVKAGAFKASLTSGRKVKMLRQHDTSQVIGIWDSVDEDAMGLRCKGRLLLTVDAGKQAYELVRAGAMDGLSIGYRTVKSSYNAKGQREIQEAELWEVSVVTFPMNAEAVIDAVKARDMTKIEMERVLTQDAGLSRSVARRLMAGGLNAVKAMQDAGDDGDELVAALRDRLKIGQA
jgi:uncharacterized protein